MINSIWQFRTSNSKNAFVDVSENELLSLSSITCKGSDSHCFCNYFNCLEKIVPKQPPPYRKL